MPQAEKPSSTTESAKPTLARMHIWQIQWVRDLLTIGAAIGIFWLGYVISIVTVPLLVALLLAYLFEPLVSRLSADPRLPRPMVVSGLLCVVLAVLTLSLVITIPLIVGQTSAMINSIRSGRFEARLVKLDSFVPETYREEYRDFLRLIGSGAAEELDRVAPLPNLEPAAAIDATASEQPVLAPSQTPTGAGLQEQPLQADRVIPAPPSTAPTSPGGIGSLLSGSGGAVVDVLEAAMRIVVKFLGATISFGLQAFLIAFFFFYFSVAYPQIVAFIEQLIPRRNKARTLDLLRKMDAVIAGFVRGRIVISVIMGVMFAIGWQACGVPWAIPLGFLVGLFSLVPYLGGVGLPIAIGLLWFDQLGEPSAKQMAWYWIIAWPTIVFIAVQVIESYILTPWIAGKATNLDPVSILAAVLAGGALFGVYGMLIAIPLVACIKILVTEVLMPRIKLWLAGHAADPLPIEGGR